MNRPPLPADLTTAVKLGGEMGQRFADFDWAGHPLGPPQQWAAETRTTLANSLTSQSPTIVFLGAPQLFVWHNDAYLSLLGHTPAGAVGRTARELWSDSWDQIGPILTGVLSTGVGTCSQGLLLPAVSDGEPRYFTFAVNPVLGSDGAVSAVIAAVTDIAAPVSPVPSTQAEQSTGLMRLEVAVQAADSIAGLLDVVLGSPFASGDAAAAAIGVVVDGEDHVQFEFAGAVPAELRDRYHVARLDSPLVGVDVLATGQPMVIPDTLDLPARYTHAANDTARSVRACVARPLRAGSGRLVGVLALLWPHPRRFAESELQLFARTADITESALDRIRLAAREHRIAVDFQEHLLDLDRGSTAAAVAARYQPAGEAMRVGGDWFSATRLDHPDQIGVSVGDVAGHGLPAAIVMSRLRAAVTVSALTVPDPAAVLGALDRYALTVAGARCATVAYAAIDTSAEPARMSYLCAGHPYPLLVHPDQGPVYLEAGRRSPVATDASEATTATADLPPGSLVLLYTDGLIERAGEALDDGFDRLKAAAAECADLPVDSVCAELLHRMTPPGGYRDDVVVLAVRPRHAGKRSCTVVVPATSDHVPAARDRLREWLATTGVARQEAILLAASEAVTNAIEHGSRWQARKTVWIEAFLRHDGVSISVSDTGRWVGDSSASRRNRRRGRGLTLISGLADQVQTVRTAGGTRVTLSFAAAG